MKRLMYLVVALSVAACSGGSKGQATGSARPTSDSTAAVTTTSATTTPSAAVTPSPAASTAAATSPTPAPTATQTTASPAPTSTKPVVPNLKTQVLTLDELPPGWSARKVSNDNSGEPACFKKFDDTTHKPVAHAEVEFQASAQGLPSLDETIDYVRSGAAADFVKVVKALRGCGKISITSDGTTLTGTIAPISFPPMGDNSKAYQMTLSGVVNKTKVTAGFDVLLLRIGGEEVTVLYATLGVPDIREFQAATKLVVDKIQGGTTA